MSGELTPVGFLNRLLRRRRLLAGLPALLFVVVIGWTLLAGRTWTTTVSFVPQTPEGASAGIAGLAAQFGVAVPSGEASRSPRFYVELLRTPEVLAAVASAEYRVPEDEGTRTGTLADILEIEGDSPALRLEMAKEALLARISTRVGRETGIITVSVRTDWPELSAQVAGELLAEVNRFNLETRQTEAAAERRFAESRLEAMTEDLQAAEARLEDFLRSNRQYERSPELTFRHDRLERQVTTLQQVYTSLLETLEQARLDEVRNTPVITVLQQPRAPVLPDRRRLILKGLLAILAGVVLALAWIAGAAAVERLRREEPAEYEEFRALRDETLAELRSAARRVRPGGGDG